MNKKNMVKKRISITLNPEILEKVDKMIKTGKYYNRSHLIQESIKKLINNPKT